MPNKSGLNLEHIGRYFKQGRSDNAVNNNCLLLDSYSTISYAKNDTIVTNITVIPPSGQLWVYRKGPMECTLSILPMSNYLNGNSMSSILYLKEAANSIYVTMDTNEDHSKLVHFKKYKAYRFMECGKGIYYLHISDIEIAPLTTKDTAAN